MKSNQRDSIEDGLH